MVISTIILSNSEQRILKMYLEEHKEFRLLAESFDSDKIYDAVNELSKALLFVDMDYMEQDYHFISFLRNKYQDLRIIAFTQSPSTGEMIKAMRAGASGLLSVPFIKDEVMSLLDRVSDDLLNNHKEKSKCRIITIFSNKGGIGKTSIASNLALELAKISKEDVALVDLNFQLGDVTTFWDLKPSFDLTYMVNNPDQINKEFLLNTLEKYKNTSLHILADPPFFKGADNISSKQIESLISSLKGAFSYVVIDTSAGFDNKTMVAIKNSDIILLVTVANLPALRNTQRCIELFNSEVSDRDAIQVVVNRYMENDEIGLEDIEKLLAQSVFEKIPNNYFTMMSAINKGVPVSEINNESNVAKAYRSLALKTADFVYRKK